MLDTINGPVLYKAPCARAQREEILMTIKPTLEHIAIQMPVCASRLTASASYVGRLGNETFLDRRPNKF